MLATLTVNSNVDNITADSYLTFREATLLVNHGGNAILALNRALTPEETAQYDSTEAFGNNDTIQFASPGTILLGEQITLSRHVNIVGLGADVLAFDANGTGRVIEIARGKNVTISDVLIIGGYVTGSENGGGILNEGNLTLDGVVVAGNSSENSGGGLYSSAGRLDIFQSSFELNTARYGGGITVDTSGSQPVNINGSTFFANQANVVGVGAGGGMFINGAPSSGNVIITNSTFSSNSAAQYSGALRAYDFAKVFIVNSTFAFNSAGINGGGISSFNSSSIRIHNSIVSANSAPSQANANGLFDPVSAYNLVGSESPADLRDPASHNIVSDFPGLGVLGYHGGLTKTHELRPDSPAVDAGSDYLALSWGLNSDQRKSSRPVNYLTKDDGPGGTTDIGAFELKLPGIADVVVDEDAPGTVIDLESAFGRDASVTDFEILTNTDPSLFNSVIIQAVASSPKLILNYAPDRSGPAYITVALHHASGVTDTLGFQVLVNPVNDTPTISATASELIFDSEVLEFSSANGNAITIGDNELSGSLVEILSPHIPDVSYSAQNSSRLFFSEGVDDYSAYGFGNNGVAISSYLFDAGKGTSLEYFINSTDEDIRFQLAQIPEKFDDPLVEGVRDDEEDWHSWINGGNPYMIVDIEGPAHPKEWQTILEEQGINKLHEVFDAYKRRVDLAHEMYPELRLLIWGAPSVAISSTNASFPYMEAQINTLDMAIQYGVFDHAYGFLPRLFQHWGDGDTAVLSTSHLEDNMRTGIIAAQEAIKRAVEATHGSKGSHLKVVPNNTWIVFSTEEDDPVLGTVNQGEEYPEGYYRQLTAIQDLAEGVTATIRTPNSEAIQIAQVPAVLTAHLHLKELEPLSLDRYAQGLQEVLDEKNVGELEVSLTANHGRLYLGTLGEVEFTNGDGIFDTTMAFRGSLEEVNRALDGLRFVPEAGYTGDQAGIVIEVDDQGTSGYETRTIDVVVGKEIHVNVVNDLLDSGPVGDGIVDVNPTLAGDQVSLRAAILEANAMNVPTRITLRTGQLNLTRTGEDTWTEGDLDISGHVEIVGAGAGLTMINAGGATGIDDRVFEITNGSNVSISGVTITGGKVTGANLGGGILNAGNLTLDGVVVAGNSSQSSGGGLYSSTGNLSVSQSSFDNNTARYGGGISLDTSGGTSVRIDGSTFYANTADVSGIGAGGGLFVNGGTSPGNVNITNSTFSGNNAAQYSGGLRAYNSASVFIINSTFTLNNAGINGGGIGSFTSSLVTIHNSIVSANTAPSQADANGLFASFSAYNLVGTATPLELRNSLYNNTVTDDPGLGALSYNGGLTRTHALQADSLAVDAGFDILASAWGISTDQRGQIRPVDYLAVPNGIGGTTDIGAYELQNAAAAIQEEEAAVSDDIDGLEDVDAAFEQLTTSPLEIY